MVLCELQHSLLTIVETWKYLLKYILGYTDGTIQIDVVYLPKLQVRQILLYKMVYLCNISDKHITNFTTRLSRHGRGHGQAFNIQCLTIWAPTQTVQSTEARMNMFWWRRWKPTIVPWLTLAKWRLMLRNLVDVSWRRRPAMVGKVWNIFSEFLHKFCTGTLHSTAYTMHPPPKF